MKQNRIGKITASRVGAVLGLNPYQSPNALMREMVLESQGKAIQKQNADLSRGLELESKIIEKLQEQMRAEICDCGENQVFKTHDEYSFLGATPDGYFLKDGAEVNLEIKAPRAFYSDMPPYYYAQIQLQMAVFNRNLTFFVQGVKNESGEIELKIDKIERSLNWLDSNIAALKKFYNEFLENLNRADDFVLNALCEEFVALKQQETELKSKIDSLKDEILQVSGGAFVNDLIQCSEQKRSGGVDYARFIKENNITIPQEFFKADSFFYNFRIVKKD